MTENLCTADRCQVSRRGLFRGGVAAAALAALPSCDSAGSAPRAGSPSPRPQAAHQPRPAVNVRVTHDRYREHVGPSVAVNPRDPRQLLVACQASPAAPELIVTYISLDAGVSWQPVAATSPRRAGRRRRDRRLRFTRPRLYLRHALRARPARSLRQSQRQPGRVRLADRRRRAHLLGTADGRGAAVLRSSLAGHRPRPDRGRGRCLRHLGRWPVAHGSRPRALDRRRTELRAAAPDPGGGQGRLAGQRGPSDRRRTARPGVRGLRLVHPAGLLRRPGRPGHRRLLDRFGPQLRRAGPPGSEFVDHRAARQRQGQQRPHGRRRRAGRCPLRRVPPAPGGRHPLRHRRDRVP